LTATLDGAEVRGVLFDYGETLVTFRRPDRALQAAYERIEAQLRREGWSPPVAQVLVHDVHDRVEAAFEAHRRSGSVEEIDLVAEARDAYADLGIRLDHAALDEVLRLEQEAWWEGVRVDPEAVPTLDALRSRGLRVGLCSNAPYRVRSMHDQLRHLGLRDHLDAVTFSGEIGWRKPSPRIFEAAVDALQTNLATTIVVGDNMRDDVCGPRALGMRAIMLVRGEPHVPEPAPHGVPVIRRLSAMTTLLFGT
jgi:putative hydrolase of the HAD superfamily